MAWMGCLSRSGSGRNDIRWAGPTCLSNAGTYLYNYNMYDRNGIQWLYISTNGTYRCLERISDTGDRNNIRYANMIFTIQKLTDFPPASAVYTPTMNNVKYVHALLTANRSNYSTSHGNRYLLQIRSTSTIYQLTGTEFAISSSLLYDFSPVLNKQSGSLGVIFGDANTATNWANYMNSSYNTMRILYSDGSSVDYPLSKTIIKAAAYYPGEDLVGESLSYFYMAFIGFTNCTSIIRSYISQLIFI